jgi:hypothetical protein
MSEGPYNNVHDTHEIHKDSKHQKLDLSLINDINTSKKECIKKVELAIDCKMPAVVEVSLHPYHLKYNFEAPLQNMCPRV